MITPLKDFECGNSPAELYPTIQMGSTLSVLPCKNCGKVLFSIKDELVCGESTDIYAYFKCVCGKKYRKLVMTSESPNNNLCGRALAVYQIKRTRQGTQGWNNPTTVKLTLLDEYEQYKVYYVVSSDSIIMKRGSAYNG